MRDKIMFACFVPEKRSAASALRLYRFAPLTALLIVTEYRAHASA
jgi:hypothetical protein